MEDQLKQSINSDQKSDEKTYNDVLVAGFKVQNKSGGPQLTVVGFIMHYPSGPIISYGPGEITYGYTQFPEKLQGRLQLYSKVRINYQGLTGKHFGFSATEVKCAYWFYTNSSEVLVPSDGSDYLFLVCKRWSEELDDYKSDIFNIHEVEICTI